MHLVSPCPAAPGCTILNDKSWTRYPASKSCIANVNGKVHNDVGTACFSPGKRDVATEAINNGCDCDCGGAFAKDLGNAFKSGAVTKARGAEALARILTTRFKLGEFDPVSVQPYENLNMAEHVNSKAHQQLALEAAQQSITLLKNDGHTLPLSKTVKRVATSGPNSNCTIMETTSHSGEGVCNQLGNYATIPPFVIAPTQGIAAYAEVTYDEGSGLYVAVAAAPNDSSL